MLGETCLSLEEMEKALDYFENGLYLAQRTKGDHPLETELTKKLSELAVKSGDMAKALIYLENGFLSVRKNKDVQGEGSLLIQLGRTHQENNENDQTAIYFEEALELSKKNGNRELEGEALWKICLELGLHEKFIEASERANEVLKIFKEIKHPDSMTVRTQIRKWGETSTITDNENTPD